MEKHPVKGVGYPNPCATPDGGTTLALLGMAMTGMAWMRRGKKK